jgi:hypothetical protein
MARVDAWGVVALVKYVEVVWDRAINENPRQSMRVLRNSDGFTVVSASRQA